MASDSRVTAGPVSYETRKVHPILLRGGEGPPVPLAIAGGAGDATLIKQSYRLCERVLWDLASSEWNGATPTFEEFEEAVARIEDNLTSRLESLRGRGLESSFSLVLAGVGPRGRASIYLFDERGLAEPVHDNPGFAVVDVGFYTGGNLLLRLLGYSPEESGGWMWAPSPPSS